MMERWTVSVQAGLVDTGGGVRGSVIGMQRRLL